ncbi:hypothetical protein TAM4_2389 [Thermococcus sp. AM4]|nr:hypothetical protein TAM4_2389 [Thermococcus sp. AM4]
MWSPEHPDRVTGNVLGARLIIKEEKGKFLLSAVCNGTAVPLGCLRIPDSTTSPRT